MAFLVDATMKAYEVRSVVRGTSRKGNEYMSMRVESVDGRTAEISVTGAELFPVVESLSKGDICNFDVRAVAGKERSYIQLIGVPVRVANAYEQLGN